MSESSPQSGSVRMTPEGGPVDAGVPAAAPGAGQVQATPEAAPIADEQPLTPPTLREHMRGPIPGLDDVPPPAAAPAATGASATQDDEVSDELRKWPPHTGKPVSEADWRAIGRYAAPIAAQAERLAIKGIDLSARGLSRLARYLEARRDKE